MAKKGEKHADVIYEWSLRYLKFVMITYVVVIRKTFIWLICERVWILSTITFFAIFQSDVEKIKSWKLDLLELQSSEDIEISPEEVKEMVTEAKKAYPYTFYNSNIPPDHDLRVVKVVSMCSSLIQLPHESRDLSRAEKGIIFV